MVRLRLKVGLKVRLKVGVRVRVGVGVRVRAAGSQWRRCQA